MEPFSKRHLGITPDEQKVMLERIGVSSLKELMDEIIPDNIKSDSISSLPGAIGEEELLLELKQISEENFLYRSYIGMGYYNTVVPSVIQRNLFENPGWYTQYTPYQAEISQGRLESLLNFQTMVMSLTGMDVANASLLDEATAAAEAMTVMKRACGTLPQKKNAQRCLVSRHIFPQTLAVLQTRANPLNIELVIKEPQDFFKNNDDPVKNCFGMILQFPLKDGDLEDYSVVLSQAQEYNIPVTVITDIMSLVWLSPPGEWRVGDKQAVDVVVGSTQRFGVPLGYGGPQAAFIASRSNLKRLLPGRIIGVTKDVYGRLSYRMSLQTREQHIRREKATSNICTAQSLLANMSAMYAVYHGPKGLQIIAGIIHLKTELLAKLLKKIEYTLVNQYFFDTLTIAVDANLVGKIRKLSEEHKINFYYYPPSNPNQVSLSLDETVTEDDLFDITKIFYTAQDKKISRQEWSRYYQNISRLESSRDQEEENRNREEIKKIVQTTLPSKSIRKSPILIHEIFNRIKTETQMMRYLNELERKDISLNYSMISLGSCTMKLNPASTMIPLSWKKFSSLHPFIPLNQAQGYQKIFRFLEKSLALITGMDAVSLQPNSGAQGEYAGLMAIRNYHLAQGESGAKRNVIIIPTSAHGTNPASATMAGMEVVLVGCLDNGDVDIGELEAKIQEYGAHIAGLMLTYPSTHGIYEEGVKEICDMIHECGGQVYMDGANMNAQIGFTSPGKIGADVCHLNLHKTFAIPHGGGGPGVGPIAVKKHLLSYLPSHSMIELVGSQGGQISATPWGSAGILPTSYAYIRLLGNIGLKQSTQIAILNANYLKFRLSKYFRIVYEGRKGKMAHEFIVDIRPFEKTARVNAEDVSKRLMDYGFHAPTMSFPIPGTLMIEPTESEDKGEMDSFCEAMISIREEIDKIEKKEWSQGNNPLVNAPHSQNLLTDEWKFPYTQQEAFFPLPFVQRKKFWPPVSRVDNVYGDKNFFCSCPSPEMWQSFDDASK